MGICAKRRIDAGKIWVVAHTSQAGNRGGVAVSLLLSARGIEIFREYSHEYLKRSKLLEVCRSSAISMHDLRSCAFDVLSANQLMHGRTGSINGVEDYKVAVALTATFETDDGN